MSLKLYYNLILRLFLRDNYENDAIAKRITAYSNYFRILGPYSERKGFVSTSWLISTYPPIQSHLQ